MSLIERRDCANGAETAKPEKERAGQRYSVSVYVSIFFAVVVCVVLLSYFMQQRSSAEALENLTAQHNQFSISALQKIEELQDANVAYAEQIGALEAQVSALEEENGELTAELAGAAAAADEAQALQRRNDALSNLMRLEAAVEARDFTLARELSDRLEAQIDDLGEFSGKYLALKEKIAD